MTGMKTQMFQLVEFFNSSRKITVPTERLKSKIPKTLRKACGHAHCRETIIVQVVQLPHVRDHFYEALAYLTAI